LSEADTIFAAARGKRSNLGLAVAGAVLSAVSCALVFYTAGAEPYIFFRWSDFVLNVALGAVVFVLFVTWGISCVRTVWRTPRRGALAATLVCASVLWTAINLFYLSGVVYGYTQDLRNPRLRALR